MAEAQGKLMLNYLTPHGKWHIHSTYGDNQRMTTLSRGCEPFWMNDKDAAEIGIEDNDWVEVHNDHGVVVPAPVSAARIPRGICIIYHSPERTVRRAQVAAARNRRAGGHNSLTRTRLKPEPDGRWLRAVHLPLQLLGTDRLQPRHAHLRARSRTNR